MSKTEMIHASALFLAASLALVASPASAFCSHDGELYAKTTLEQEYREARWVVRARVLSATDWENRDERGTLYRLEVVDSFKGEPPEQLLFSTERNTGGFYLDTAEGDPDLGGEYLLFLVPNPALSAVPPAGEALWVNYACGQSGAWRTVPQAKRNRLIALARTG
jgi:hypothetical protein